MRQASYTGATDAGRGALILRNGSHRRIISGVGNGVKQVTVIHSEKNGNPIGQCTGPRPRRQGRLVRGGLARRRGHEPRLHRALALRCSPPTGR